MEKALILLITAATLFSCATNEKEAREQIEKFIQQNAHDAKSYEFIGFDSVRQYTIYDSISNKLRADSVNMNTALFEMELSKKMAADYEELAKNPTTGRLYADGIKNYQKSAEYHEQQAAEKKALVEKSRLELDRLQNTPHENIVLRETYTMNFRIKNLMGAYFKTYAKIDFFPQTGAWSAVQMAPNPFDSN